MIDTWHNVGLRGTGSSGVAVGAAFVPRHRSFTLEDLLRPGGGGGRCHSVPFPLVAGLQFVAPILGAARGAQRDWLSSMAGRRRADGRSARDTATVQFVLARSSAEIHAAQLLVEHAAQRADHGRVTALVVAQNQRDVAMAAELCATAVDRIFRASGAQAQRESSPLQRSWRDVTVAAGHATLEFEKAASEYAKAAFAAEDGRGR